MILSNKIFLSSVLVGLSLGGSARAAEPKIVYPVTVSSGTVDTYFGVPVADPYRWLENGQSKKVQAWVQSQNKLAQAYLTTLPGRTEISAQFKKLIYLNEVFTPRLEGQRLFYERRRADKEKPLLYWQEASSGLSMLSLSAGL